MEKYYEKLELNKIMQILQKYCITEIGTNKLMDINPSFDSNIVRNLLSETSQAIKLISESGNMPLSPIDNFEYISKTLEGNLSLSCSALLSVAHILKVSRELKKYFTDRLDVSSFDAVEIYFSKLYSNPALEEKIFKSIIDENTVADEASSELRSIRRKKHAIEANIKDALNNMIHSSYSKYVMDTIITIRNDRYVIPVKIEYKDNVKGFVHDTSYSGSTVFIEPMSIFEMNNKIQNLQIEENIEIERILKELSDDIYPVRANIEESVQAIGNLDLLSAKAKFSMDYKCTEPIINDKKIIDLKQARHPLIDKSQVVPVSIEIGRNYTSLIITGPNTGGKTVCLKTTGLLCLMAYIGLHIPTADGSSIYVFDNIFADIGDEQSIQESLSTFSSHMINIVNIYSSATENSLILVDELGSGTDPVEGANLAISILEYFHNLGALTLATTHYPEIKNYALVTDGFENASSEFDIENLKSTYKLLVGIPGKSNAFAITKRLGMPDSILNKAQSLMNTDNISIEELIKNIYDDKIEIEKEKEKITQNLNQIELLRKSLENEQLDISGKQNELIEKAKAEAREILLDAKKEANSIISELNEIASSDGLKQANNARNRLNKDIQDTYTTVESDDSGDNTSTKLNIQIGMKVHVKTLNQDGVVLSNPNKSNEVQIQIGSMKTNVKISNLELLKKAKKESNISYSKVSNNKLKAKTASTEINVIGQTVDEAIFVVDKFLDDAALSHIQIVRIVHGKGTGKLREGIHQFLRNHPHVNSFRMGTFGEGEMGVTVVELK
ncbi:MAG: endonuclease MutS2 [Clostridia bacterium]|nr:endonuclease MutS2 [Clostridia bacterium]